MEDELKILLPGETYNLSNGRRVEIRPVPFGKLRLFYEIFYDLMQKLDSTGLKFESVDEWTIVFELFKSEIEDILCLVDVGAGFALPSERADQCPPLQINEFKDRMAIFIIIIEQNFRTNAPYPPLKVRGEEGGVMKEENFSYVDIISTLIRAGHFWTEIKEYTLDQIGVFFDSVNKLENLETRKDTVSMFIASQGSKKNIEEYLNKLMPIKKAGIEEFLKDHGK